MPKIRIEDVPKDSEGRLLIPAGYTLAPADEPTKWDVRKTGKGSRAKRFSGDTRDRFLVLNNFADFTLGPLSRSEIVAWLILYRDTKNGIARTSQTDIARRGGLSSRSVASAVASLIEKRLVEVVRRGGLRQGPSIYRVHSLMK
jgi:hypothetical protein